MSLTAPSAPSIPLPVDAAGMIGGSCSTTSRAVPREPTISSPTPLAPGSTRLVASVARIPFCTSFDSASFIVARSSSCVDISFTGSSSLRGSISIVTGVSSVAVCGR